MGKKGSSSKKASTATGGPQMSVTMREASTGKKRTNIKSSLKLQHIKNLAVWASQDAAIPSLGAFFGHHLAASSEALATPVDPSLFTCQRCESILHPGYNCTIRIQKNKTNARHKGKKTTHHPQNNIVYTCHFCSHPNMKRGTPKNASQPKVKALPKIKALPKVKAHPKSTNLKAINTASSSDLTKEVIANIIAAPLRPISDDPDTGKMGIVEINEALKVKDDSADISVIEAPLESTADDPDMGKMGVVDISEMLKVKDDSADMNAIATPLVSKSDDPDKGKLGMVEISEMVKVKDDSADINTIAVRLGDPDDPDSGNMGSVEISDTLRVKDNTRDINTIAAPLESTADDPDRGKMAIVELNETSKITDISADINIMAAPLVSTADDPEGGKMGIVEISEVLKAKDVSTDMNTITATLGSASDDPRGEMGVLEISETMEVKNDPAESSPATPLARPTLTLLESKMRKRNRSGTKKKGASEKLTEASNAENSVHTSKRKRRKSWTSLNEIAERDENDKRKRLMNVTVPFYMQ